MRVLIIANYFNLNLKINTPDSVKDHINSFLLTNVHRGFAEQLVQNTYLVYNNTVYKYTLCSNNDAPLAIFSLDEVSVEDDVILRNIRQSVESGITLATACRSVDLQRCSTKLRDVLVAFNDAESAVEELLFSV